MKINQYRITLLIWILIDMRRDIFCCTFPVTWDGTWYDSTEGTLTISKATLQVTSGWVVTLGASSVTTWTCVAEDTSNNYLVFRGDSSLNFFSSNIIPYLCIHWTNVTDNSFYYYILADYQSNGVNERAYLETFSSAITSWSASTYCSPSSPPGDEEFHMAVRQGYASSVYIDFPPILQGTHSYTYTHGGSVFCSAASDVDICADTTTAKFNYTLCSTVQLFSRFDILKAVAYSGKTLLSSVSAGSCEQSQSPAVATSTGGVLSLSTIVNCTSDTSTTSSASTENEITTGSGVTTESSVTTGSSVTTENSATTESSLTTESSISISSNNSYSANETSLYQNWFCSTLEMHKCYGILAAVCVAGTFIFFTVLLIFCVYKPKNKKSVQKIDKLPTQLTLQDMTEPTSLPVSPRMCFLLPKSELSNARQTT
ncbi:unnamed protein product [Mytilus edulis]|uniref:Uncharacterized protein n=1 Tax=Mytilus edulis TaxID=6550 RepID=A0A8S3VI52_MYTED|nr:unnamed protein product [Mytilus edulis]